MRLVHASDLHLGFRAFQRQTASGINAREADVAGTFRTLVTRIIELAPDLVVIGGDIFHAVKPPNAAIVATFAEFARLRTALPRTPIVMVAGNHDAPRASDTGSILQLFTNLGIHVAERTTPRIQFGDVSVLCVPEVNGVKRPPLEPDRRAKYNVLLMHGEVEGTLAKGAKKSARSPEITTEEIAPARWDYVALGDYHVYREIAPNCYYSGSIDYTSTNIWGEVAEQTANGVGGKGFIERDLATGAHTFHPLPASRRVVDLGIVDAADLEPAGVDAAIADAIARVGGIDGAIARIVISDISREKSALLDQKALRAYRAAALNFVVDPRRPDVVRLGDIIGPALQRGLPLEEIVMGRLAKRDLAGDIDRDELQRRATSYLDLARDKATDDTAAVAQQMGS